MHAHRVIFCFSVDFAAHVFFQPTMHCFQNLVDFLPVSMLFCTFGAKRHGTGSIGVANIWRSPMYLGLKLFLVMLDPQKVNLTLKARTQEVCYQVWKDCRNWVTYRWLGKEAIIPQVHSGCMGWAVEGSLQCLSPNFANWDQRQLDLSINRSPYHRSP